MSKRGSVWCKLSQQDFEGCFGADYIRLVALKLQDIVKYYK